MAPTRLNDTGAPSATGAPAAATPASADAAAAAYRRPLFGCCWLPPRLPPPPSAAATTTSNHHWRRVLPPHAVANASLPAIATARGVCPAPPRLFPSHLHCLGLRARPCLTLLAARPRILPTIVSTCSAPKLRGGFLSRPPVIYDRVDISVIVVGSSDVRLRVVPEDLRRIEIRQELQGEPADGV